jgi:hypothetical protein
MDHAVESCRYPHVCAKHIISDESCENDVIWLICIDLENLKKTFCLFIQYVMRPFTIFTSTATMKPIHNLVTDQSREILADLGFIADGNYNSLLQAYSEKCRTNLNAILK